MRLLGASTAVPRDLSYSAFKALEMHQNEEPTFYHLAVSRPYRLLVVALTTLADAVKCLFAGVRMAIQERKITFEAQNAFVKSRQYLILTITVLMIGMLMPDYLIELRSRFNLDGTARKEMVSLYPQVVKVSRVAFVCLAPIALAYLGYQQVLFFSQYFKSDETNPRLAQEFDDLKGRYSSTLSWECYFREHPHVREDYTDYRIEDDIAHSWNGLLEFVKKYPGFLPRLPSHPKSALLDEWCDGWDMDARQKCRYGIYSEYNRKFCPEPPMDSVEPGLETDPSQIQPEWDRILQVYNEYIDKAKHADTCQNWRNENYDVSTWLPLLQFARRYPSYLSNIPPKGFIDIRQLSSLDQWLLSNACGDQKGT